MASCCACSWSMRTSAINCCSARLWANTGDADMTSAPAASDPTIFFMASSLRRDHEMRAAVLRPGRFIVPRVERELLAVAHGPDAIARNAERDEVRLHRYRPPLAERQVVLGRAALVAMSLDRNHPRRIFAQRRRIALYDGLGLVVAL